MAGEIKAYQDAVRAYEQARQAAALRIKLINDVGSKLRYSLPSFLGWHFGVPLPRSGGRLDPEAKVPEIVNWPDADTLRAVLKNWAATFEGMHEAWRRVPEEERVGLRAPPPEMRSDPY